MNHIGEFIRATRKELGLTQQEFAEALGAIGGQAMVSRWERGHVEPGKDHLRRIGELAGIDAPLIKLKDAELPIAPDLAQQLVEEVPASPQVQRWILNTIENAVLRAHAGEGIPVWLSHLRRSISGT